MKRLLTLLFVVILLAACSKSKKVVEQKEITYVNLPTDTADKEPLTLRYKALHIEKRTVGLLFADFYYYIESPYLVGDKVFADKNGEINDQTNGEIYEILYQCDRQGKPIGSRLRSDYQKSLDTNTNY